MLQVAIILPGFKGRFVEIAHMLDWTNGRLWMNNPSINIAQNQWNANIHL